MDSGTEVLPLIQLPPSWSRTAAAPALQERRSVDVRNAEPLEVAEDRLRVAKRKLIVELQPVTGDRDAGLGHIASLRLASSVYFLRQRLKT